MLSQPWLFAVLKQGTHLSICQFSSMKLTENPWHRIHRASLS